MMVSVVRELQGASTAWSGGEAVGNTGKVQRMNAALGGTGADGPGFEKCFPSLTLLPPLFLTGSL